MKEIQSFGKCYTILSHYTALFGMINKQKKIIHVLTFINKMFHNSEDQTAKVGSQEISVVASKYGLGAKFEAGQRLTEFCQENALVIANTLFQQHKRRLYTWTSPDGQYRNQIIFFEAKNGETLYSQQKQDQELTVAQIINSLLLNSDLY